MRWGPDQDVHFSLIIWHVAKIIPTLQELILYVKMSLSNVFDIDINLLPLLEGGVKYCKKKL